MTFQAALAKYILDSGEGQPDPHALTLTQDEIAAAVGSTRVTVNKVLADFEHRGLIRVARRHIDVLAPDRLRKEIHGSDPIKPGPDRLADGTSKVGRRAYSSIETIDFRRG